MCPNPQETVDLVTFTEILNGKLHFLCSDRMVTYLERLSPIKLLDPLVTWICKIKWESKTSVCPQLLPMDTTLHRRATYLEGIQNIKSNNPWLRGLTGSRDKLKALYLHYRNVSGHQTCRGNDLLWRAPTPKITWSFNDIVLRGNIDKLKPYANGHQTRQGGDLP